MRVGFVIYGSLETISGGYLYDRQLVHYLKQAEDEVDVISLPYRSYREHLRDNGDRALIERINAGQYDILLQDELCHPSLYQLNHKIKRTYPIVSIIHHLRVMEPHPDWHMPIARWVERSYLRSVDGFICNSQTTRKTAEDLLEGTKPHIISTPAGNRLPDHQPATDERQSPRLRILFVGNVIPRKEIHTLITSLAYLDRDMFELRVVGNTDVDKRYHDRLQMLTTDFHLEHNVTYTGVITDDELVEQYQWADVLVVPSAYEGFGIVYMEAMKYGVPAVASHAGAAHEIVMHNRNGFLVQPGDIHGIGRCLKKLYTDRSLLARMSDAARRRYDQHPSWTASMSRIRVFMQRMVSGRIDTPAIALHTPQKSAKQHP